MILPVFLLLQSFNNYDVIIEAANGKDLQKKMSAQKVIPGIMLALEAIRMELVNLLIDITGTEPPPFKKGGVRIGQSPLY